MTKVEQYLIDLTLSYREIGENLWLIEDSEHDLESVAVAYTDPLVIIRTVVMNTPDENKLELYTKLLELNAKDVVHGAYALDENQIILVDTLEYDTMDKSEFRATLDAFIMAIVQHYPILSAYRNQ
ncbi:MAG: YbjN domain-containing protein [Treponema sp.]|jgi:hypothetical protein|nr:YbjN domain-containing protein [Treponema sp.]